MNTVQIVAPNNVYSVWDGNIANYLEASINVGNGDCTLEQLKLLLVKGDQTLLVSVDEKGVLNGAMTVEFINHPNARVMFITALGGHGIVNDETFSQVETWAKMQGATKVSAWAQKAQARLYKIKSNFNTVRYVVEKDL
jgi:hypothetical protein